MKKTNIELNSITTFHSNKLLDLIKYGEKIFSGKSISNGKQEIQWFLQKKLSLSLTTIQLNHKKELKNREKQKFLLFIKRRICGEPFQYIINTTTFYGKDFFVNPSVLIPRPETELIIAIALKAGPYKRVLDIGTGAGNLAIILALNNIAQHVEGLDICSKALEVAKYNCNKYKLKNIKLKQCDFLNYSTRKSYDLIVSNPPYISYSDYLNLENHIKAHEPQIALTDNKDGLTFYKYFSKKLKFLLKPKGRILIEIGLSQTKTTIEKLFAKQKFHCIWHKDLNGDYRVLEAYK